MAVRRSALERVGPFDDRMLNYYDDVDYGTRLWRAGYRVVVAADADEVMLEQLEYDRAREELRQRLSAVPALSARSFSALDAFTTSPLYPVVQIWTF